VATRIVALAERPELVPTVARWHWELWGAEDPAGSVESWTARAAGWANHDAIPMIFVALAGKSPVGSVSLMVHDLSERRDLWDLWPWLSGLYVVPEWRGQGFGRALVARAEAQARSMGVARLYLYTASARGLYELLGWEPIGEDVQAGAAVTIMCKRVGNAAVADLEEASWLATLRPSRVREIEAGATSWTSVDLAACSTGAEPYALRAVLESLRIRVNLVPVGQARHLVRLFDGSEASAPFLVLACHGEGSRILLPCLAPQVERFQPYHGSLGPQEIAACARLAGRTVICAGCDTGTPELAEAFLAAGCDAYLGPAGAPFGYASTIVVAVVFFELIQGRSIDSAVDKLAAIDSELAMWRLCRP
jgi:GNAT superfamily N-acetyltransferase